MARNKPRVSMQEITADFREVDLALTGRVPATGNALRVTIPQKEAEFWDIQPGDNVHLKLDKVKRRRQLPGDS